MQVQSDIFLGWTSIAGRDYLVRQLRDHKAGIEDEDLAGDGLVQYAQVCGELLAKGHAAPATRMLSGDTSARATSTPMRWPTLVSLTQTRPLRTSKILPARFAPTRFEWPSLSLQNLQSLAKLSVPRRRSSTGAADAPQ